MTYKVVMRFDGQEEAFKGCCPRLMSNRRVDAFINSMVYETSRAGLLRPVDASCLEDNLQEW